MKLTTAIEILTNMGTPEYRGSAEKILQARKLGIKAIERFRNLRNAGKDVGMPLLKGETKEGTL